MSQPDPSPKQIVKAIKRMRRLQPHLYSVFRLWLDGGRKEDGKPYHGFYADVAKRLSISAPGVRYRLGKSWEWLSETLKKEMDRPEDSDDERR